MSGFERLVEAVVSALNGFGAVNVFRGDSNDKQHKSDYEAFQEKHGTDWDKLK